MDELNLEAVVRVAVDPLGLTVPSRTLLVLTVQSRLTGQVADLEQHLHGVSTADDLRAAMTLPAGRGDVVRRVVRLIYDVVFSDPSMRREVSYRHALDITA